MACPAILGQQGSLYELRSFNSAATPCTEDQTDGEDSFNNCVR